MTGSTIEARLRPGRDANDTSWIVQRYARDWKAGVGQGVRYDPAQEALVLRSLPRPEIAADWLPLSPVKDREGNEYKADPENDLILRKPVCADGFSPIDGFGGSGFATGQLNTPTGLALDSHGRLYVADSGNGRVQVWDIARAEVVAVLTGDLVRPVHLAVSETRQVYVVDTVTRKVHVFSASFVQCNVFGLATIDPWTGETWRDVPAPRPLAITILADGSLAVFDPLRPLLWHMTASGCALEALAWPEAGAEPPGWAPTAARFEADGEIVLGPLDGGTHDLAWHRILVDADTPERTSISVQTFASNRPDAAPNNWAPLRPVKMPTAAADRSGAEFDRLVQSSDTLWNLATKGLTSRAKPDLFQFDGDGPVATDKLSLPAEIAARLQVGDVVRLTDGDGNSDEFAISAISDRPVAVLTSGALAAFVARDEVTLVARNDGVPAFGPVNLANWMPPAMPALAFSGSAETTTISHLLATILEPGDVISFLGAGSEARVEILEIDNEAAVEITLDRVVDINFANALLTSVDTVGRLVIRDTIETTEFLPEGNVVTLVDDVFSETHEIAFIDGPTQTIWLAKPMASDITAESWTNLEAISPRATDRGRYLWVRLVLSGRPLPAPREHVGPATKAVATPRIRMLRVTGPRPNLLNWLPAIFSERDQRFDAPGALFLERFLALFEGQFTRMEDAYESVSRLLNPRAADKEWLDFLAAWMDFAFDPSWPIEQRRLLVIEGAELQSAAGTPRALERYLEIYTGAPASVAEDFQGRPPPPMQLGARGALGIAPLGFEEGQDRFAHQFSVRVTLPSDRERDATISAIRRIVDTMKPAHTTYRLDLGEDRGSRIGMNSTVGGIFIPGSVLKDPCLCDPEAEPGPRGQTGQMPDGFRLGGHLGRGPISEFSHQGDPT